LANPMPKQIKTDHPAKNPVKTKTRQSPLEDRRAFIRRVCTAHA